MNWCWSSSVPPDWRQRRDPVPDLIDLDALTLWRSRKTPLESVLGRNALPVEYDLIPLPVHQEPGRICLAWDFLREDEAQGSRQGAGRDDFAPYAELEQYIVTRFNVNRPGDRPRVVATQPAWIILEQGGQDFLPAAALPVHRRRPEKRQRGQPHPVPGGGARHRSAPGLDPDQRHAARRTKPLPIVGQTLALHTSPGRARGT